jgi:hypothetical protein
MELGRVLLERLYQIEESEKQLSFSFAPPKPAPPFVVSAEIGDVSGQMLAEHVAPGLVALGALRLTPTWDLGMEAPNVGERISKSVRCPYGTLTIFESDDTGGVLLRSPVENGGRFVEVERDTAGGIELRHFHVDEGTHQRTRTGLELTDDELVDLVDELIGTVLDSCAAT